MKTRIATRPCPFRQSEMLRQGGVHPVLAACAQRGQQGLDQGDRGFQVQADDVVELRHGRAIDAAGAGGAGIVDEGGDGVAGGDVARDGLDLAVARQVGLQRDQALMAPVRRLQVEIQDGAALGQQAFADGAADAGTAARDQGNLLCFAHACRSSNQPGHMTRHGSILACR